MDRNTQHYNYLRAHIMRSRWYKVFIAAAAIVVFITTYMLILPAITLDAKCGKEEHKHEEACYKIEHQLICKQGENAGHTHSDSCYQIADQLICGLEESGPVVETIVNEETGESETVVVSEGHTHDASCFAQDVQLICGMEESEGHTHTESCYKDDKTLSCSIEEHTHTESCYHEQSDPNADVENEAIWRETFKDVTLTGNWGEDIVAIAKTQVGYKESSRNFIYDQDDEKDGYTRYGAWYGDPYGEWCAMFSSFCINYAEVGYDKNNVAFPLESNCANWINKLQQIGYFHEAANSLYMDQHGRETYTGDDYFVKPGDLIFFNLKNSQYVVSDHVGLVTNVTDKRIYTIQGNSNYSVLEKDYAVGDATIVGFGEIPENPNYVDPNKKTESEETVKVETEKVSTLPKKTLAAKSVANAASPMALADEPAPAAAGTPTDFKNNIKGITISKDNGGHWTESNEFTEGDRMRVDINFEIPAGVVTQSNPSIYYDLPGGLLENGTHMDGYVYDHGNPVGTYTIDTDDSGNTRIILNYYPSFADGNSFTGSVFFTAEAGLGETENRKEYDFDGTNTHIVVKKDTNTYDLSTTKSASLRSDGTTIDYEIRLSSNKGTDGKITLTDQMFAGGWNPDTSKPGATYNGQVTIEKHNANGSVSGTRTESPSGNSFEYSLDGLAAGEYYLVKYSATVNDSAYSEDGSLSINNNANGNLQNHPEVNRGGTTVTEISQSRIRKSGKYNNVTNQIDWEITVLNPSGIDLNGKTLDDVVNGSGVSLVGNVSVIDANYQPVTNGTVNTSAGGKLFTYTFGNNTTSTSYTIKYTTTAPADDGAQVSNTGTFHDDGKEYTGTTGVGVEHRKFDYSKSSLGDTFENGLYTFDWQTSFTLPDGQFPQDGYLYQDTIKDATTPDGTVYENSHSGTYSEIVDMIQNTFQLSVVENSSTTQKNWTEATASYVNVQIKCFKEENGQMVETTNDGDQVKFFTVNITPKTNFTGTSCTFKYPTHGTKDGMGGGLTYYSNEGLVPEHDPKTATVTKRTMSSFEKRVYSGYHLENGREKRDWEYATGSDGNGPINKFEFLPDGAAVDYGKGIITYRILINTGIGAENDKPITITDIIPDGMEYTGNVYAADVTFDLNEMQKETFDTSTTLNQQPANPNYNTGTPYVFNDQISGSVSGNTLTINLPAGYQAAAGGNTRGWVAIYYQLRITDPEWNDPKTTKKTYVNNATWTQKGLTDTQTTEIERPVEEVHKVASPNGSWQNGVFVVDSIDYNIVINPLGEDLDPKANTIELVDTFDAGLGSALLELSSVTLYEYSETAENHIGNPINPSRYQYKYDANAKKLTITIPDELPCVLRYRYDVSSDNVTQDYDVKNTVSLQGKNYESNTVTMHQKESGAISEKSHIVLHKVDKDDYGKSLAGVEFEFKWMDSNGSDGKGHWNDRGRYTTDANGQLIFDNDETDTSIVDLKQNYVYRLIEKANPNKGYVVNSDPYYFVWLDGSMTPQQWYASTYPHANLDINQIHFLEHKGASIYIENEYSLISVKKVWVNADGTDMNNPPSNVKVQLNKVTKSPDGKTVTIVSNNNSTVLQIADNSELSIEYPYVYWQDPNNYPINIDSSYMHITTKDAENGGKYYTVIIDPAGLVNGGTVEYSDYTDVSQFKFHYTVGEKIETTSVEQKELSSSNNWSYTWENLPADGIYNVIEVSINGETVQDGSTSKYIVSYTNNDGIKNGEIVVTNKAKEQKPEPETTQLTVEKKWKDHSGNEMTGDALNGKTATIKVMQISDATDAEPVEYTTFTLPDLNGNWSKTLENLPKKVYDDQGNEINYKYYVVENDIEGFTVTYEKDENLLSRIANYFRSGEDNPADKAIDHGKITVTNTQDEVTSVSAVKVWAGSDNPQSVQVQLYRNNVAYGSPISLSQSTQWKYVWENLPKKDENGNEYTYTVQESVPEGYTSQVTDSKMYVKLPYGTVLTSGSKYVFTKKGSTDALTGTKGNRNISWSNVSDLANATSEVADTSQWQMTAISDQWQMSNGSRYFRGDGSHVFSTTSTAANTKLNVYADGYAFSNGGYYFTGTISDNVSQGDNNIENAQLLDAYLYIGDAYKSAEADHKFVVTNIKPDKPEDKPESTGITVQKVWKNESGANIDPTTLGSDKKVTLNLYKVTDGNTADAQKINENSIELPIEIDGTKTWSYTESGLPKVEYINGTRHEYTYYFVEEGVSGFTTTYKLGEGNEMTDPKDVAAAEGTITVVNKENAKSSVTVDKKWFKSVNGNVTEITDDKTTGSISFELYRVAVKAGGDEPVDPTCQHSWDNGEITKQPTETEPGIRTLTCTKCGETKTESISPIGHTHNYDGGSVTTPATCTNTGVRTYTCSGCGHTYTQEVPVDSSNHTGQSIIVGYRPATATEAGYTGDTQWSCCGTVVSYGEVIPATGGGEDPEPSDMVTVTITRDGGASSVPQKTFAAGSHIQFIATRATKNQWYAPDLTASANGTSINVSKYYLEDGETLQYSFECTVNTDTTVDIHSDVFDDLNWSISAIEITKVAPKLMMAARSMPVPASETPDIPPEADKLGTYQITAEMGWTGTWQFPAEPGYTYKYYVVEQDNDNLTTTYEGEESNHITIKNTIVENSYELPHTGGPGTKLITMLGILLMAVASSLMILKKHRKEEIW